MKKENRVNTVINDFDIQRLGNINNIFDLIRIHLFNKKEEDTIPEHIVKLEDDDFIVTYRIVLEDTPEGRYYIPVTEDMLAEWTVSREQVHQKALLNQMPCLYFLNDVIDGLESGDKPENILGSDHKILTKLKQEKTQAYVLTNETMFDGSALIMNQELMNIVCGTIGKRLCLIPYSIHQTVVIPYVDNVEKVISAIHNIIRNFDSDDDRLTDDLFSYDMELGLQRLKTQKRGD